MAGWREDREGREGRLEGGREGLEGRRAGAAWLLSGLLFPRL